MPIPPGYKTHLEAVLDLAEAHFPFVNVAAARAEYERLRQAPRPRHRVARVTISAQECNLILDDGSEVTGLSYCESDTDSSGRRRWKAYGYFQAP